VFKITLSTWDTFLLDTGEKQTQLKATNIRAICRSTRFQISRAIVKVVFHVSIGGKTWKHTVFSDLSNPEVLADGFADVFRMILDGNRKPNSPDARSPGHNQ